MALKRALRLRKSSDFQRVRQQGHTITSRLLILAWSPNEVAQLRIGFVVSKRISKHAVERNYSKRLLSEAVRGMLPALPTGMDIVFSARNQAKSADLRTIEQEMRILLHRANLLSVTPFRLPEPEARTESVGSRNTDPAPAVDTN